VSFKKVMIFFLTMLISLYSFAGIIVSAEEVISRLVLSKNELNLGIGDTQSITATAVYVSGKTEDVTLRADWTSETPGVATVYVGNVSAKAEGTSSLTATFMGKTVIVNATVEKKVKSLTKDKSTLNIRTNATQQIHLTAVYYDGTSEDVTTKADWSIDDESIATVTNGLVTGDASGYAIVTAKYGGLTALIAVNNEVVKRVDPSKSEISLLLKGTEKIQLMATLPDGTLEDVTDKADWSSNNESAADALKGVITAYGAGKAKITATYGTKTATINVDVDTTNKLEVNKQSVFMHISGTEQLILTATYVNGTTEDITAKAKWSSNAEAIAYVNKGKISAVTSGIVVITAQYGDKSILINVDVDVPRRLDINKDSTDLQVGGTEQLQLTATYANATTNTAIADKAVWTSSNEDVAFVIDGKITAYATGEAIITASYGGKTVKTVVDVNIPRKITASKTNVAFQVDASEQITLNAVYADGRIENITDIAEWSSSSEEIAQVKNGLITGNVMGSVTVTASYGTRSIKIPVSVGVISSITADHKKLDMQKNDTVKVAVSVLYTDGTKKDVTDQATWAVGDTSVAEAVYGTVTAIKSGKTNVTATFENKTVTIPVEIDLAQTLIANFKLLILGVDATKQITLTATDSSGKTKDVSSIAEWQSSSPLVANVTNGEVTTFAMGKTTITAKYGGKAVLIPVEVDVIQKLEANKKFIALKAGTQVQITLTATLSNGTTKDVTSQADWSSSSYKIVNVDKGLATIVGSGKATVSAKYGTKSVSIPVEANQLKYFKTDEVEITMKKGSVAKVIATATYLDGTDDDVSIPALWTSSNILIADVKDGKIKANGAGKTLVTVTYAGKSTKVVVIVSKN
jgi:ribosomal protein S7